jgi:glycosyltransferase involved in cell wall biosynthesis
LTVSVIIPVYNGEATVAAAVESALAQRFDGEFEVIVINDGSTDGTRSALEQFGGEIRVIDQANGGVAAARNAGIAAAAGEYIALLDCDDTWSENKFAEVLPALDKNPRCSAAFSDGEIVDSFGNVIEPHYVGPGYDHSPTLDEMLGSKPWPIMVSSMVIRREALDAIGGFTGEFGRAYGLEDAFTWLLLRERGEIVFVPGNLARWRMPTFEQRLSKCIRAFEEAEGSAGPPPDPVRYFYGNQVWARLLLERFGDRGRKLANTAIDEMAHELVMLAMMAMRRGDRAYARRCYMSSIRYRPLRVKTYMRLAWALAPSAFTQVLSPVLPRRLRRSLEGPPMMMDGAQ